MKAKTTPIAWLNGDEDEKIVLAGWVSKIIHRNRGVGSEKPAHDKELRVAENIARVLLKDLSLKVRRGLVQELLVCPTLPNDIVQNIAIDVEEVAAPFLKVSTAFTEEHLEQLVPIVEEFARVSIAKRNFVSGRVGVALIEFSSDETITVLMHNTGAEMNNDVCNKMADRYEGSHQNMEMLASRIDLPKDLADELMKKLSSNYMAAIDDNYLSVGAISDHLGCWASYDPASNIMASRNVEEVEAYVAKLHGLGRLTPEIILNSLRHGNKLFFEVSIAVLTGSSIVNIHRLITHGGLAGLERLLIKAEIPKSYLKKFSSALDTVYRRY